MLTITFFFDAFLFFSYNVYELLCDLSFVPFLFGCNAWYLCPTSRNALNVCCVSFV